MDYEDTRILLKEIWFTYQLPISLGIVFIIWAAFMGNYADCWMPLEGNDVWVMGRCSELQSYKTKLDPNKPLNLSEFIEPGINFTEVMPCPPEKVCPPPELCPVCPVCRTCPATTTTLYPSTTTIKNPNPLNCSLCPVTPTLNHTENTNPIECVLNDELEGVLLNYRCGVHESIAVQHGCAETKDIWLDLLGIKNSSRFKVGAKLGMNRNTLYKPTVSDPIEGHWCFRRYNDTRGSYFILNRTPTNHFNRSRWGWNDNQCGGSWMRVSRL